MSRRSLTHCADTVVLRYLKDLPHEAFPYLSIIPFRVPIDCERIFGALRSLLWGVALVMDAVKQNRVGIDFSAESDGDR
jgi:hypothetical protein